MFCRIEGCKRPVENKDTGLCATHGAEERKRARQAGAPKKQYRIPPVSEQGKRRKKEKEFAYKQVDAKGQQHCGGCGYAKPLTHSHILPVSQYPKHAANPENIFMDCIECHTRWEHGSWEDVQVLLDIDKRLQTANKLDKQYVGRRFLLRNPNFKLKAEK